ncbi:MAG: hypothetical protein ACM359_24035 [Bacillota bacterium]
MKSEMTAIRVLTITAALLLLTIIILPKMATGASDNVVTIKDGDFVVATHKVSTGGDALYIADTRLGAIGVFSYDPGPRELVLRDVRAINDTFNFNGR